MEQFYLWLHRQNFFEQFYGAHSVLIQNADPIARKNFLILFENPVSKKNVIYQIAKIYLVQKSVSASLSVMLFFENRSPLFLTSGP